MAGCSALPSLKIVLRAAVLCVAANVARHSREQLQERRRLIFPRALIGSWPNKSAKYHLINTPEGDGPCLISS